MATFEFFSVNCPVPGCTYATPDTDEVIVAALLTTHATLHNAPAAQPPLHQPRLKGENTQTVVPARTSEDWTYFLTRWEE